MVRRLGLRRSASLCWLERVLLLDRAVGVPGSEKQAGRTTMMVLLLPYIISRREWQSAWCMQAFFREIRRLLRQAHWRYPSALPFRIFPRVRLSLCRSGRRGTQGPSASRRRTFRRCRAYRRVSDADEAARWSTLSLTAGSLRKSEKVRAAL